MKSLKWLLVFSMLLTPFVGGSLRSAEAAGSGSNQLIMTLRSSDMIYNGKTWKAAQPLTNMNGTAYVAFKSVAERYSYKVTYDAMKKESVATSSSHELRFKPLSAFAYKDGKPVKAAGAAYILNGSLMVPLRVWAQITDSKLTVSGTKMTLSWQTSAPPTAGFEVQPQVIYAQQTQVTYIDHSTNSTDSPFVEDRWEGKMDVFPEAGTYTIVRQVMDVLGQWSEPYQVTVEVRPPNQAPVADFATDKPKYRIGERINYTDLSTDDENAIVRRTWTGNEEVFFEPGDKPVTLEVEDAHGLTHSVTKMVTVTDEVLYTQDEYNKLFKEIGGKIPIDGASVLKMKQVPITIKSAEAQMVRSNSPETLLSEGIVYQTQMTGQIRFMFHNMNKIGYPVKMYLVATNTNGTTVNIGQSSYGVGGPDPYVVNTGKMSTIRYLQSIQDDPSPTWTAIRPHESKVIFSELSKIPMKPMEVLSAYVDLYADQELQFKVVVVAADKDPLAELPNLTVLPKDRVHVRGTFNDSNRVIELNDTLGDEPEMIKLGDPKNDTYLDGIDETDGELQLNIGNFGCLYTLHLPHVAPNTLIALNGRGGYYTGAFTINGRVIPVTNNSFLVDKSEAAVLYRTGSSEESVDIVFTLAAGSNMPVALMFLPLPQLKY